MSSAVPARWLVVCVLSLVLGAPAARADRRPVAVINLDSGAASEPQTLAAEIERELAMHPVLAVIPDSSDAAALRDPIDDEDAPRLDRARQDLAAAEQATSDFHWSEAVRYAEEGQRELLVVTPVVAVKLYARLAFARGRALDADGRTAEARAAYALAHALDPALAPDPVAVPPNVIAAFAAATAPSAAPRGTLDVKGTGIVWIDGTEVGVAPGAFDADAGTHVVWLIGVDRETRGLQVTVAPGQPSVADVPDAEAPRRMKVQRARQALARAPDPTARAVAIHRLVELVGVHDAVLLSVVNGKIIFQTWSDSPAVQVPGFSAHEERGAHAPADLLSRLAPPPPVVDEPKPFKLPPPPPKKWYQKRSWQLGIAGAVAAAVVGGYFIANAMPDTFGGLKPDIVTLGGSSSRR